MVGVPGRSQGCITCRRRRVKCDLRTPQCVRCSKGGKHCEGYEPYRTFVNTFFDSFSNHNANDIDWMKPEGRQQYEFVFENDIIKPRHPFASYAAFKSGVQMGLWDCHIVQRLFSKEQHENVRPWIEAVMQNNTTTVGRDAILALAQSLSAKGDFGSQKDAAAAQYSRAINLLHTNLTSAECKNDLNNLAAIVIFYYYEMTSATHTDGWSFHAAGMAHLVELRGPANFQSGAAKALFNICRFKIIYQALLVRTRTFLASIEWKNIPWQGDSGPKNLLQKLKDIFADLPGLLEDGDALRTELCDTASSDNSLTIKPHIQNLINAFHALICWRNQWERRFPFAVLKISTPADSNLQHFSKEGVLSTTVYWFNNMRRAREIITFYGVLLHLLDEMFEWLGPDATGLALASLKQVDHASSRCCLMPFHDNMTRSEVCSEVYRCLDFLLDGPDPVSGGVQLVFPLRACGTSSLDRTDMASSVPIQIWDKVARLSGFEMVHPLRSVAESGDRMTTSSGSGTGSEDGMYLDPVLRVPPMQSVDEIANDGLSSSGTTDEKFVAILQSFGN